MTTDLLDDLVDTQACMVKQRRCVIVLRARHLSRIICVT